MLFMLFMITKITFEIKLKTDTYCKAVTIIVKVCNKSLELLESSLKLLSFKFISNIAVHIHILDKCHFQVLNAHKRLFQV